jgi:predicted MFS family arabinose efflux permease
MVFSGAVVALAPNAAAFMAGRALIGVAIGASGRCRRPPPCAWCRNTRVPRALAVLNGGNALASVVAAPLGSLLGAWVGWRGAFFCVVPVALATMAWQTLSLPALPARPAAESPIRWA